MGVLAAKVVHGAHMAQVLPMDLPSPHLLPAAVSCYFVGWLVWLPHCPNLPPYPPLPPLYLGLSPKSIEKEKPRVDSCKVEKEMAEKNCYPAKGGL